MFFVGSLAKLILCLGSIFATVRWIPWSIPRLCFLLALGLVALRLAVNIVFWHWGGTQYVMNEFHFNMRQTLSLFLSISGIVKPLFFFLGCLFIPVRSGSRKEA